MNRKKLLLITIFSMAMGYMEAVIVVYLRKIYYPDGFRFPLMPIDSDILIMELFRELATVIMLLSVGIIAMKKASEKFAVFIYCFAIWDIFYYVFLKLLINWPDSFFTPDILFLIPFPWIGPVIAPCIVSLTMIILAGIIFYYTSRNKDVVIQIKEWLIFSTGSLIIIFSFMWDYISILTSSSSAENANRFQDPLTVLNTYIPSQFNWTFFLIGELIIFYGMVLLIKRIKNN